MTDSSYFNLCFFSVITVPKNSVITCVYYIICISFQYLNALLRIAQKCVARVIWRQVAANTSVKDAPPKDGNNLEELQSNAQTLRSIYFFLNHQRDSRTMSAIALRNQNRNRENFNQDDLEKEIRSLPSIVKSSRFFTLPPVRGIAGPGCAKDEPLVPCMVYDWHTEAWEGTVGDPYEVRRSTCGMTRNLSLLCIFSICCFHYFVSDV